MVPERISDKYRKHVSPQIKGPGAASLYDVILEDSAYQLESGRFKMGFQVPQLCAQAW